MYILCLQSAFENKSICPFLGFAKPTTPKNTYVAYEIDRTKKESPQQNERFRVWGIKACVWLSLCVGKHIMRRIPRNDVFHHNDVLMGAIAFQITSLTIVYLTVYSNADQRKHQSSASLAFVRGIHRRPVNSPHKWPVTHNVSIWLRHHVLSENYFIITSRL